MLHLIMSSRRRSARIAASSIKEPTTPVKIAILPLKKQPLREEKEVVEEPLKQISEVVSNQEIEAEENTNATKTVAFKKESTEIKSVIQDPISTKKTNNENLPPIKGRKKSNCFKAERDRFKSVIKSKGLKTNLKQRIKFKEEKQRVKAYEQSLKDRVTKEKEELRARQEQNKKNREENQRKSEVVQQIKNPAKLKRMKKKQLKMIAKRDLVQMN